MRTKNQEALRMYVRAREDFQAMRKNIDNRLGRKADKTPQKTQDLSKFLSRDIKNFNKICKKAETQEKIIEDMLDKKLEEFPIYTEWLSKIKGIGPIAGGWIVGEFDIHKADTVSKLVSFSGLNPGLVWGKKRVPKKEYKSKMGKIISKIKNVKNGEIDYIIQTDAQIPGDRKTVGFLLPYNQNLKAFLLGVMAERGFKMQKNSYYYEYYLKYKTRKENSDRIVENNGKERKDDGKSWKDVSKGHRENAAKRYMVKMFLKDLYVAWRKIEGLPVRPPYDEEYLGKKHNA